MAYQEFDITWTFVKGVDNMVPDQFSRQCTREADEHPAALLFQLTGYEIPSEYWDAISLVHNSGMNVQGKCGGKRD